MTKTATFLLLSALLAAPLTAQSRSYNDVRIEGEIVSAEIQPYTAPGPEGSPRERVCFLRVQPFFHHADPHHDPVDLWMQGEAADLCLEFGTTRAGDYTLVRAYLKTVTVDGVPRIAAVVDSISVSE